MRRWMMMLAPAAMVTMMMISLSGCDSKPAEPGAGGEVAAPAAPAPAPAPAAKSNRTAQPAAESAGGSLTP